MSELLWVAVPGGRTGPGEVTLRVLIVPRLDAGITPAQAGLAAWPPPELRTAALSVDIAEQPDSAADPPRQASPIMADAAGAWEAFFGTGDAPVRAPVTDPGRALAVDPTSAHAERIERTYRESAQAMRSADSLPDFHAVVRTLVAAYGDDAEPTPLPTTPPLPPMPPPDFHRTLSLLREHPAVLRALGLILELPVALDADGPAAGVVRIRWDEAPAALPPITSPWSAFTRSTFLPAPAAGSDLESGMVALSRPHWELRTLDVGTALGRLRDAARADDGMPSTLPALRTAGVMLVRAGREQDLATRNGTHASRDGTALRTLTADDLLLGVRVDVKVFGQETWFSLCRRRATYQVGPVEIATDAPEEGHVKMRAAVDHGDGALRLDEVAARWDGWSMAVPRPVRAAPNDTTNGLPFDFRKTLLPEPGSLLRLEFGTTYQLRARVADVAGGGRPLDDESPDGSESTAVFFTRHEPIAAPVVALPTGVGAKDLGPGGAVDLLVVRTGDGEIAHPADRERTIEPPRTATDVVERHGKLTGDIDRTLALLNRDGLPDPAAVGVAAFVRPEPGVLISDLESRDWDEPWPDHAPKRLHLEVRQGGAPTVSWDGDDDLMVRLSPAEQITLELSSYLTGPMLGTFAINGWIPRTPGNDDDSDDAVTAVVTGRHPMVTPARAVKLVHAVRAPIDTPAGGMNAIRTEDQAFAILAPSPARLGVHPASTAQLEITASWDEVVDGADTPQRIDGAPVTTVAVARGAERLPEIRHEFGDTKHRRVTYGLRAISRFRDFFDPAEPAELFRTDGTSSEVLVPSSARPAIPLVRSVVPAFTWEESRGGAVLTRRRLGGRLRVELAPPWFTTGAGERLAVVTAAGEPDPSLWPYLTQVGRDPIWDTPIPPRSPQIGGDPVLLSENGAEVRALGHPVWSFGDSRYADVAIPADGSYSALAQLAVARYQPHSIPGAHLELSPVVRTDFVPLLPHRTLTVDSSSAGTVTVTLDGLGPAGPIPNRVSAVLETAPGATSPRLVALAATEGTPPVWSVVTAVSGALGQTLTLNLPAGSTARVRVREIENVDIDGGAGAGTPSELSERVVFTDTVDLTTP